jgi:hypothetical protein
VDTTPPVVTLKAELEDGGCEHKPCVREVHATFDAEDATSPIAHAEYSLDAGPWQFIAPVGEISDSKREHYVIPIAPQSFPVVFGEHLITVRVYDRYDNVGTAKAVVTVSPPK